MAPPFNIDIRAFIQWEDFNKSWEFLYQTKKEYKRQLQNGDFSDLPSDLPFGLETTIFSNKNLFDNQWKDLLLIKQTRDRFCKITKIRSFLLPTNTCESKTLQTSLTARYLTKELVTKHASHFCKCPEPTPAALHKAKTALNPKVDEAVKKLSSTVQGRLRNLDFKTFCFIAPRLSLTFVETTDDNTWDILVERFRVIVEGIDFPVYFADDICKTLLSQLQIHKLIAFALKEEATIFMLEAEGANRDVLIPNGFQRTDDGDTTSTNPSETRSPNNSQLNDADAHDGSERDSHKVEQHISTQLSQELSNDPSQSLQSTPASKKRKIDSHEPQAQETEPSPHASRLQSQSQPTSQTSHSPAPAQAQTWQSQLLYESPYTSRPQFFLHQAQKLADNTVPATTSSGLSYEDMGYKLLDDAQRQNCLPPPQQRWSSSGEALGGDMGYGLLDDAQRQNCLPPSQQWSSSGEALGGDMGYEQNCLPSSGKALRSESFSYGMGFTFTNVPSF
ncbi:hypothetical protein BDZ45DRAFT_723005 [Acephala macrosclerotiorum]|nr:hypothetical protein BDZ45DRAFT_723005 [Acephala macrosclerotiorum]